MYDASLEEYIKLRKDSKHVSNKLSTSIGKPVPSPFLIASSKATLLIVVCEKVKHLAPNEAVQKKWRLYALV
jgi:hypothetical protein